MGVTEQMFDLGEVTLAVDVAHAPDPDLRVLLLHGFTGNRNDFEPLADPLARLGWSVAAPDHRGHGRSDKPDLEEDYSFAIFAGDVCDLADALGWTDFVLLGHSMGGMIAQEVVLRAPGRVRGLVLMDTSHREVAIDPAMVAMGVKLARDEGLDVIVDLTRDLEDPLATPAHLRLCETVPGYKERGEQNTRMCSAAMYAAMLLQITEPHDRIELLRDVSAPTLVLVGEQDTPFREPSERMASTIPGATLAVLPDAGHSPQFEAPDALFAALVPFLDRFAGRDDVHPVTAAPAATEVT